jgi:hypothetical protein
MSIEAMTQALEALETLNNGDSYKTHNAATALRQAIAEAEWIGLDKEMMRNTTLEFNRGALWAERYLKEKNT